MPDWFKAIVLAVNLVLIVVNYILLRRNRRLLRNLEAGNAEVDRTLEQLHTLQELLKKSLKARDGATQ